jgi:hypothetical protein
VKYKPRAWKLAAKVVYSWGVGWAIKSFEPYKAPETDGIYPILLQEGPGILLGPLTKDFGGSIALRYVPPAWRATKLVIIPKPSKNDLSQGLQAYQPYIFPTNNFGQIV